MGKENRNRVAQYCALTDVDVQKIHDSSIEILSEVGFKVHSDEAYKLFKARNVKVDSVEHVIRLRESEIMDIISTAPSKITLYGRNDINNVYLGSGQTYFGTGGTALNVLDYETKQIHSATMKDLIEIIRIADKMKNIHLMLLPTYPNELQAEKVDVNRFFAGFLYTQKHVMGGVYTEQGICDVIKMAEKIAGSPEALRKKPFLSMITCGISPLCLDSKYGAFMMQIAREGIPLAVPVEPLCGTTSPITLAGNLVIQNCDSLINIILTQLVNPGTPVIYGCVATSSDLKYMTYLGAPVESGLINSAASQMSRYYNIPCYTTAGISDSKTLDAQCGYESAINNLLVAMSGADFIHDAAGLMEFALTVSKEKLVIDNEILGIVLRSVKGIELNNDTLALDEIKKVGPGGHFIRSSHTRKYMHSEHYKPQLSDRDKREVWNQSGMLTTEQRAHEIVERLLASRPNCYLQDSLVENIVNSLPIVESVYYQECINV